MHLKIAPGPEEVTVYDYGLYFQLFIFLIMNLGNLPRIGSNIPTQSSTFLVFVNAHHVDFCYCNHGSYSAFFLNSHYFITYFYELTKSADVNWLLYSILSSWLWELS